MAEEFQLQYVRSDRYHSSVIDNASVLIITDPNGERLSLLLTKTDAVNISERALKGANGEVQLLAGTTIASESVKAIEFSAELRPDAAFLVINTLNLNDPPRRSSRDSSAKLDLQRNRKSSA